MILTRCTGSWGILAWGEGQLGEVPVGRSVSWGKCHLGEVPLAGSVSWGKCQLGELQVEGSASLGKCQLGDFNLSDFLGTISILIHFYLMNATNKLFFLHKIYTIKPTGSSPPTGTSPTGTSPN